MKAGVFASPNHNLIYVRKDQTIACTTIYPSEWPEKKVRYSEKADEVTLFGYTFKRVADVPNGCTKPVNHLRQVAVNLGVCYPQRLDDGTINPLQPFVTAEIGARYMHTSREDFWRGVNVDGPDFADGSDAEGFPGGDARVESADAKPAFDVSEAYAKMAAETGDTSYRSAVDKQLALCAPYGQPPRGQRLWNAMMRHALFAMPGPFTAVARDQDSLDEAKQLVDDYRRNYPAIAALTVDLREAKPVEDPFAHFIADSKEEAVAFAEKHLGPRYHSGGFAVGPRDGDVAAMLTPGYLLPVDEAEHRRKGAEMGRMLYDKLVKQRNEDTPSSLAFDLSLSDVEARIVAKLVTREVQEHLERNAVSAAAEVMAKTLREFGFAAEEASRQAGKLAAEFGDALRKIEPVTVTGRPLHPQMKKVGITGVMVNPDSDEMRAIEALQAGEFRLCHAKSARKHRRQGHRVWFHTFFNCYAWSKESAA